MNSYQIPFIPSHMGCSTVTSSPGSPSLEGRMQAAMGATQADEWSAGLHTQCNKCFDSYSVLLVTLSVIVSCTLLQVINIFQKSTVLPLNRSSADMTSTQLPYRIAHRAAISKTEYYFETSYLSLVGNLWVMLRGHFRENRPCYEGTALYLAKSNHWI